MLEKVTLKKTIRMILFLVPFAVLANVGYTIWSSDDANLPELLNISVSWLVVAVFFSLAPWLVASALLGLWARFFQLPLVRRDIFEVVLANDVAAAATPTAIGGGYAKLGLLIFHGTKPGLAASLMVIGSLEEYAVFAVLVPLTWAFYPPENINVAEIFFKFFPFRSLQSVLIAVGIVLVLFILLRNNTAVKNLFNRLMHKDGWLAKALIAIKKTIGDFRAALRLVAAGGKLLFLFNILLAALQWGMRYSVFTALAFGFGLQPHPIKFLLLQWLLFTLMNIVPTPGAIGGAEIGFALIFKGVVPPGLLALSVSAWRFVATYLQLIVAAIIMVFIEKPEKKPKSEPVDPSGYTAIETKHAGHQP